MKKKLLLIFTLIAMISLTACVQQAEQHASSGKLQIVATTTIVGDVVSQVGGDLIELSVLLPVGMDPHGFDPTPQDIAKVAQADVIFANGLGLEEFLDGLIEGAGAEAKLMFVSEGVDFLTSEGADENDHEGQNQEHSLNGADPHTWTDPHNVLVWIDNIEKVLSEVDPENADDYAKNANLYQTELEALDAWIREQVALLPAENRKLVTDHALFGYFVKRYGFEQVGALIPGYSTLSEPTAQELAAIEDAIRNLSVNAIFVGNSVNPALAERVAEDLGVQLIYVYTGSLSRPDGEAATYIEYMRYNTTAFVNSLK